MGRAARIGLLLLLLAAGPAVGGVEDSERAVLLVASPQMLDPNFARTVVLVSFPQDVGPMGVVLNRPVGATLGDILTDRPDLRERRDPLFFGGPVEPDGILFVFRAPEHPLRALPVVDDLYFSGDGTLFDEVARAADGARQRRFFAGYAGWAVGQLDAEVARGDWYVLDVDADTVFDIAGTPDLWARLLQRARATTAVAAPVVRCAATR
ncbi:MAG: YqgE/AlgH family protein [Burkholderiales bacterium]|nr:YqgE/AlgH family protein [Burkholderiales bacterium]